MAASIGSGGLITDDAEMRRWLARQEREAQREAIHLCLRGDLTYAELRAMHPELWAHCKQVSS